MTLALNWTPPTLTTDRLIVRALTEADAEAVYAYASNPNMTHYTLWDTHRRMSDTVLFVRDYAYGRYLERVPEPMGLCLRERPDWVIGTVGTFWVGRAHGTMELGYALSEAYWGRGMTVEACQAIIDYTFEAYAMERLQARVMDGNEASVRVLAKLGFTYEGTLRSSLYHRGRFRDVQYHSLLRSEWLTRIK